MIQRKLTPPRVIVGSFLFVIIIGSLLLYSPLSLKQNIAISYLDALFVAVSATCVTGLTPVVVADTFNGFGQFVLLTLIQIGGIGLVTCVAYVTVVFMKKLPIKDKHIVKDMLNYETLGQFKQFILKIIKYVFVIESIGTICFSILLFRDYKWHSIFQGVFLSISAFCNAGFDLFGSTSLAAYRSNYLFQIVVMTLIVLGSLGFVVWADSVIFLKNVFHVKSFKKSVKYFSLHTKIVYKLTLVLIIVPATLIFFLESSINNFSFLDKLFASLFQSITLRTAGFYTIDFSVLKLSTLILMLPVMFIGGSSGGTAGGVKTTSIYLVYRFIKMIASGRQRLVLGNREVRQEIVQKAFLIVMINIIVLMVSVFLLSMQNIEKVNIIDYIFEATSAIATVGISTGITSTLSSISKLIIIALMFIGRIGILTILIALNEKNKENMNIKYPSGKILVG